MTLVPFVVMIYPSTGEIDMHTGPATKNQERFRTLLMIHAMQLREASLRTCLREDRAALLSTALTLETMARGVQEDLAFSIPEH
jgi:hypothetical protein